MIKKNRHKKNNNSFKFIIILLCLFLVLFLVRFTISRYQTEATSDVDLISAMYVVDENYQELSVNLEEIVPRDEPYVYNFTVSNNDGTKRTETELTYDLKIITTTNLPLTYELTVNGENAITTNSVDLDEDGTYFRTISTDTMQFGYKSNEKNKYTLKVFFPSMYNTINYQDIIEGIKVQVDSKQIID